MSLGNEGTLDSRDFAWQTTNPNCPNRIERRRCPLYSDFSREFLELRRPVVITGALDRWRALSRWTPEFFKQSYGSVPLHANNQPYTLGGFLPERKDGAPLTLGEFIDLVLGSSDEKPARYLRNVHIEKFLPELNADLRPVPDYFSQTGSKDPWRSHSIPDSIAGASNYTSAEREANSPSCTTTRGTSTRSCRRFMA